MILSPEWRFSREINWKKQLGEMELTYLLSHTVCPPEGYQALKKKKKVRNYFYQNIRSITGCHVIFFWELKAWLTYLLYEHSCSEPCCC